MAGQMGFLEDHDAGEAARLGEGVPESLPERVQVEFPDDPQEDALKDFLGAQARGFTTVGVNEPLGAGWDGGHRREQ